MSENIKLINELLDICSTKYDRLEVMELLRNSDIYIWCKLNIPVKLGCSGTIKEFVENRDSLEECIRLLVTWTYLQDDNIKNDIQLHTELLKSNNKQYILNVIRDNNIDNKLYGVHQNRISKLASDRLGIKVPFSKCLDILHIEKNWTGNEPFNIDSGKDWLTCKIAI